jgi:hypothetical protein
MIFILTTRTKTGKVREYILQRLGKMVDKSMECSSSFSLGGDTERDDKELFLT